MGDVVARLLNPRPISFHYKKPYADGEKPVHYDLSAEEVAVAFPELAVHDKNGHTIQTGNGATRTVTDLTANAPEFYRI